MAAGGAERVTADLANGWAGHGHEVHVITLAPLETDFYELDPRVRRHALDMVSASNGPLQAIRASVRRAQALRHYLRACHPDIVVAMTTTPAVLAVLAARGLGSRVIVEEHIHPPMLPVGRAWEMLRRLAYPRAFRVVVLTSESLDWLRSRIPGARGVVIPNPVSYPIATTQPVLAPGQCLSDGRRMLLAVGRLAYQKDFGSAISAFASLAERFPEWDLVILGEGPERSSLEALVARLGLGRRVLLPGVVGNVGDWYERADLYVMSSRFEGFPMTLAEALAYGCPSVSYDCDTGPRDLIEEDRSGLLVRPVGDVAALATALEQLMGDEARRRAMAVTAMEVRDRYSQARILELWGGLFSLAS